MNFYKRYLGDYARDTAHLSLVEHGAYNVLLDTYYATERGLPVDKAALYRIAKAISAAERKAVDRVADEFFAVNGDGTRHNRRADEEIGKWESIAQHNRTVGKLGGRPKNKPGKNPDDNPSGNPSDSPEQTRDVTQTEPAENPNQNQNQKERTPRRKRRSLETPLPEGFSISDRVRLWAENHSVFNVEAHFESFVSKCRAKGYTYVDWDAAFINAISDDWARIGKGVREGEAERLPI